MLKLAYYYCCCSLPHLEAAELWTTY